MLRVPARPTLPPLAHQRGRVLGRTPAEARPKNQVFQVFSFFGRPGGKNACPSWFRVGVGRCKAKHSVRLKGLSSGPEGKLQA